MKTNDMIDFARDIVIAIPKGRIFDDLVPKFKETNFSPEKGFFDPSSRKLVFNTNITNVKIIKVRSFDVVNFVSFGGADLGVCGLDVMKEFASKNIYPLLNLEIGKCRLSIASKNNTSLIEENRVVRIASKYINITSEYCKKFSIQAEIMKLTGSLELIPNLGICDYILDLVSSGNSLKENNLIEIKKVLDITSYLIVNKYSLKNKTMLVKKIIKIFNKNNLMI